GKIELYFNEPSSAGLNSIMNEFWGAWHDVSNNPSDQTARVALLQQADQFAGTVQDIDAKMNNLRLSLDNTLEQKVTYVNSLATQIAALNGQIIGYEADGRVANDLRDRRDALQSELAQLINFSVNEQDNGSVALFIDGEALVWYTQANALALERDYSDELTIRDIRWEFSGKPVNISSGEIGGVLAARDTIIPAYIQKLDDLAQGVIEAVNSVHTGGVGLSGFTALSADNAVSSDSEALDGSNSGLAFAPQDGSFLLHIKNSATNTVSDATVAFSAGDTLEDLRDAINTAVTAAGGGVTASISSHRLNLAHDSANYTFFFSDDNSKVLNSLGLNTFFSGSDASNIAVNAVVKNSPAMIAAAKYVGGTDTDINPGDNSNALEIISLRSQAALADGATFDTFYNTKLIGALGVEANQATRMRENQEIIVAQLQTRIDESSGVSLDEEMSNLLQFQQAYIAAAKYMVVVGQALDELLRII
ncbi:MAG: flagellar hook-associated protein FlgK, partial [Candidatus Omnitrophica bacterium]|nr:flagellar hook-associated protein FlgK [Candidatus Omnitrophota bacterium]